MFSKFFIERPIFASVISIVILLAGAASIRVLPIEQYPNLLPPVVSVAARYPGASPDVISQTVAARLGPPPGAPPDGVHTLNLGGGFEFIDAVGPQGKRAPQDTERAP